MSNLAIFLNGIPASGKSSVARAVKRRRPSFQIVAGDDVVREVAYAQRVRQADLIWSRILEAVEEGLATTDVLVDAALTARQVAEARSRLGASAAFVLLRIDERTRARRQALRDRRGKPLGHPWRPEFHSMPGGDELYEIVLDAGSHTAQQCAEHVLELALRR